MPNYLRPKVSGATIFFTVSLAQPGQDLLCLEVERLRAAVQATRSDLPFAIDAWVVLPDHLHAIWTLPRGDSDFSTRWKLIKSRFTRSLGKLAPRSLSQAAKGEAGIWQRRFWDHHIRDTGDFGTHLHYCWSNPVKHGLVRRAADWPYSSIQRDISRGWVDRGWNGTIPDGQFGE